jgi:hypothetical protein
MGIGPTECACSRDLAGCQLARATRPGDLSGGMVACAHHITPLLLHGVTLQTAYGVIDVFKVENSAACTDAPSHVCSPHWALSAEARHTGHWALASALRQKGLHYSSAFTVFLCRVLQAMRARDQTAILF